MFSIIKNLMPALALIMGLVVGVSFTENKYNKLMIEEQAKHIVEMNTLMEKKDATINLLLQDMVTSDAVQSAIDKRVNSLQYSISKGNREILQATDRINSESILQCRQLLSESTGLLGEGVGILRDTNRRLEAVIGYYK